VEDVRLSFDLDRLDFELALGGAGDRLPSDPHGRRKDRRDAATAGGGITQLRSFALRIVDAVRPVRGALLDDVHELVRDESSARFAARVVGTARERDIGADRVRLRPARGGRIARVAIGVDAYAAEVVPELRFHLGLKRRLERSLRRVLRLLSSSRW